MGQPAVVFDRVWKKFRRGERHDSLRDLIPSAARRVLGRTHPHDLDSAQDFWAVKDVSFEVRPGEALGVIGSNGAGKSTILKLLTKILRPTRGGCAVRGRIGALIEVSAGFHPDLTGRENIYLQGAVMGMRRSEIGTTFDAIVDFSGLSEFIDTPIKRYSSGMNARLGFSIAAHLNPEVLIIDEVLAVGDAAFQQRCYERIRMLRANGVTLIFVSHNLPAVEALCDRTLVMWHGEPLFLGDPQQATDLYLRPPDHQSNALPARGFERHGNGAVEITRVRLLGGSGQPVSKVNSGMPLRIEIDVRGVSAPKEVVVGIDLVDSNHLVVFGENGSVKVRPIELKPGESAVFNVLIESLALPEGRYYIGVAAHSSFTHDIYDWHKAAYPIDIAVAEDMTRIGRIGFSTRWNVQHPASAVADHHELMRCADEKASA